MCTERSPFFKILSPSSIKKHELRRIRSLLHFIRKPPGETRSQPTRRRCSQPLATKMRSATICVNIVRIKSMAFTSVINFVFAIMKPNKPWLKERTCVLVACEKDIKRRIVAESTHAIHANCVILYLSFCFHTEWLRVEQENRPDLTSVSSFSVNKGSLQSTSMIVPVWVSNPSTGHEIMTYALLDTQSHTTFILDELVEKLQFDSRQTHKTRLSLSTMTSQNTVIESTKVRGLCVRALNSTESVSINHAYSRSFIPAERSHIPTKEATRNWPRLRHLYSCIPSIQACEVGLLIGYNCPQALAPKETITGKANEPYAIRTILGWSVVGYSKATCSPDKCTTHRIFVKERPVCTPRDVIRILETDFQHDEESYSKLSHQDMEFIRKLSFGIRQREDHHLEMPLPFMKERPCLPNNRSSASHRLESLKRKFAKNEKYMRTIYIL